MTENTKKITDPLKQVRFVVILLTFLLILYIPTAGAQITPIVEPIVLSTTPSFPSPNQTVRASIESYALNLGRSPSIRWFVDGVEISPGENARNIILNAGDLGSSQIVRVAVETEIGTIYTKDVTLRPALVDLLWQADSYTPAFYKGKALSPSRSKLRVQAIAQFKSSGGIFYDPDEIVYTWKQDGRTIADSSGRGSDSVAVRGPVLLFGTTIEVTAQSIDGFYGANNVKTVIPSSPKIVLYEDNPLLGIRHNRALDSPHELTQEELTFVAEPYFFTVDSRRAPNLSYAWTINRSVVENPSLDKSSITLRPSEEEEGQSEVGVTAQNISIPLQRFTESIRINFNSLQSRPVTF
jgi:hypothetical protein